MQKIFPLLLLSTVWHPVVSGADRELDAGFQLLYHLRFDQAREQFNHWQHIHPDDPMGPTAEAAAFLFEEFERHNVLTSEFFLDDDRLLGGIKGKASESRKRAFNSANRRAADLARRRLASNPQDVTALLAMTITTGMHSDYASLIEKRQFASLRLARKAGEYGSRLLAVAPHMGDGYMALGTANYIIACLPAYKRFFLRIGGVQGDKRTGIEQLTVAARKGHYLQPFAKMLLYLAYMREKQPDTARRWLVELETEFPRSPVVVRERAKLRLTLAANGAE
jgi:hypothetical protein